MNDKLSFGAGYNYSWQNSDAVIEYAFGAGVPNAGIRGHSLYFMRNHFFNFDVVAQPFKRVSFYAATASTRTRAGDRLSSPAAACSSPRTRCTISRRRRASPSV